VRKRQNELSNEEESMKRSGGWRIRQKKEIEVEADLRESKE